MSEKFKYLHQDGDYPKVTDGECVWCFAFSIDGQTMCDLLNELFNKTEQLKKENEELKSEIIEKDKIIANLKDARQSYKQDWKACVSYCDTYKDEIHTLKDEIKGLTEEKEELKSEITMLKTTISRNEAYIKRLTHNGDWGNTAKTHLRPKPVKSKTKLRRVENE